MCPRGRPRGQGRPGGLHLWQRCNRFDFPLEILPGLLIRTKFKKVSACS